MYGPRSESRVLFLLLAEPHHKNESFTHQFADFRQYFSSPLPGGIKSLTTSRECNYVKPGCVVESVGF